jgi:hypothetical protein
MDTNDLTRRQFLSVASVGSLTAVASSAVPAYANTGKKSGKLAILGGQQVRTKHFSHWPIWDKNADEDLILSVLRSGVWSRNKVVAEFEKKYAELMGAKRCIGTTNGTNALLTALHCLDIGIGDEVLVTPYTFVASIQVIFLVGALPIMIDPDPNTFQINPDKMEAKIGEHTKAIIPVHILGLPAHMDKINAIAKKHNLVVVEDACQAWMAEWKGKKCGTLGDLGCFSFQNSKNLPCGEGGAIVGNDDKLMDKCYSYHDFGRGHGTVGQVEGTGFRILGNKCRVPGGHPPGPDEASRRANPNTQRKRPISDVPSQGHPGHCPTQAVRWRHPGGVSSISVPLRKTAFWQRPPQQVSGRPEGRGHSMLQRI